MTHVISDKLKLKTVKPKDRHATHTEVRLVGTNSEGKAVDNLIHSVYRASSRGLLKYTSDRYSQRYTSMAHVLTCTADNLAEAGIK